MKKYTLKFSSLNLSHFVFLVLTSSLSFANVVGNDAQNFNPTTNGIDYLTVHSSETLAPGVGNFGIFLNYSVNTLPFLDGAKQNFSSESDKLLSSDWSLGLGLTDGWDIGMNMPYQISQELSCSQCAYFQQTGITDYKINTKIRLKKVTEESFGSALVLYSIFDNTEDSPFAGSKPGPSYGAELVFDKYFSEWRAALNFGHRWRNPGDRLPVNAFISRVPNTWTYSTALSRYFDSIDTGLIMEIFGSSLAQDEIKDGQRTDRSTSSLEILTGVKTAMTPALSLQAGLGRELIHGFGTPDIRIYAGMNYNFGPLWTKTEAPSVPVIIPPAPVEEAKPQFSKLTFQNMHFKFNSTELEEISEEEYQFAVDLLRSDKAIKKVEIEGHTDSVGGDSFNQRLSEKRSQAMVERMKVDSGRADVEFSAIGYGESQPIDDNRNYQGRLRNRRVVLNVFR